MLTQTAEPLVLQVAIAVSAMVSAIPAEIAFWFSSCALAGRLAKQADAIETANKARIGSPPISPRKRGRGKTSRSQSVGRNKRSALRLKANRCGAMRFASRRLLHPTTRGSFSPLAFARIGGARFGPLLGALCAALHAQTALGLDVGIPVILAVVVGDLVAGFDVLDRLDPDAAVADHRIGVRPARMIDISREVRTLRSVDGPARVHLEPVAIVAPRIALRVGQQRAQIFDDVGILLDRLGGEDTKPGARTRDAERAPSEHLRIFLGPQLFSRHSQDGFNFRASLTRVRACGQRRRLDASAASTGSTVRVYCLGT